MDLAVEEAVAALEISDLEALAYEVTTGAERLKKQDLTGSGKIDVIRALPEENPDFPAFKSFSLLGDTILLFNPGGIPIMRSMAS